MTVKKVKRPLGLSQSIKQKKAKRDDVHNDGAAEHGHTVNFEVPEEDDPDDQLCQIQALFKGYLESDKSSPKLLNGIIHECDALLRHSSDVSPQLYKVYAQTLLECGRYEDLEKDESGGPETQTHVDFVEAAIEKTVEGLEKHANHIELQMVNLAARAELVFLELARTRPSASKIKCAAAITSELAQVAGQLRDKLELAQRMTAFVLEVESSPQLLSDQAFCVARDCFREFQDKVWLEAHSSKEQELMQLSVRARGELLARQACDALNEIAENDTDNKANTSRWLEKAELAADLLLQGKSESAYPLLAETYIAMGNVQPLESKEQADLYKQAVKFLKRAQRLGLGDFTEMIDDLTDD